MASHEYDLAVSQITQNNQAVSQYDLTWQNWLILEQTGSVEKYLRLSIWPEN